MTGRKRTSAPSLFYGVFRTRIGRIGVAATARGVVLVKLKPESEERFKEELRRRFCGFDIEKGGRTIRKVEREMRDYLNGKRRRFTVPFFLSDTRFRKKVYSAVSKIPYGETRSYKEIASMVRSPGASRAVGNALRVNPIPLLIPCHRVIASDGTPGGFSVGLELKKRLLSLEGSTLKEIRPAEDSRPTGKKERAGRQKRRC